MVMTPAETAAGGRPFTVREIVRLIRRALETAMPRAVAVVGEIADFRRTAGSGHLYFALRDGEAVLRCVMFRADALYLRFEPRDGVQVEVHGLVDLYERQGQLQLRVSAMAPAGRGALMAALEVLRAKLAAEGLFARERKKPLPRFVRTVGLVTSPSGAALRDVVRLLRRRAPHVRILLAPALVQGPGAPASLAGAIALQNRLGAADVLLVGRGGGALEDLWAFNEEVVVRAIAGSRIPVVSAVGHESDVTLADLAADERASTPSHAVELVAPDMRRLVTDLTGAERRLVREIMGRMATERHRLAAIRASHAFRRPEIMLAQANQRTDELAAVLGRALGARLVRARAQLVSLHAALPPVLVARGHWVARRAERALLALISAGRSIPRERSARVAGLAGRLDALGPGQVLRRGYALVRRPDGRTVTGVKNLAREERLRLDFHDGHAAAVVSEVVPEESLLKTPAAREERR